MYRWLGRGLCFGVVLALLPSGCGRGKDKGTENNSFLFKITSEGNTVYLLGAIHVGKDSHHPLPKEIEDAFAASKSLAVEVDDSTLDPVALVKKGMYPPGKRLSNSVSKKTREALQAYVAGKGAKMNILEPFQPMTAAMMLIGMELMGNGWVEGKGIDKHFMNEARKVKKPVREVESAEIQIRLMTDMQHEMQEMFLAKTIEDLPKLNEQVEAMWKLWQTGDLKQMDDLMLSAYREHKEFVPLLEKMFDERNVGMAAKIEGYLKEREPVFVVVGAGHLVGEKGLLKILEDKKYKVEQMKATFVKKAS
jgi:uncharacterized protein YbaP (TraB family)